MSEIWMTVLRVAIGIGIALFMFSVADSMEKIAKALTRLAKSQEANRGKPADVPPSNATN